MDPTPELRPMPSSDPAFARAAAIFATDARSPAELQTRLRALYPRAVVRERSLVNEPPVLYLYRDGRYQREPQDGWWTRSDNATASIDLRTGTIVEASPEWASLLGDGVDRIQGRPYVDFLVPEAVDAAAAIIGSLRETGEITSEMLMRTLDGSLITLEFHAELRGDRIDVAYRPRPQESEALEPAGGVRVDRRS
jgi:PAS domain-containing protein